MLASARFRAHTIQDLVHVLNGMIQQQFAGQPFSASLNYIPAAGNTPRSVTFNIALSTNYTQTIDLDFGAVWMSDSHSTMLQVVPQQP